MYALSITMPSEKVILCCEDHSDCLSDCTYRVGVNKDCGLMNPSEVINVL